MKRRQFIKSASAAASLPVFLNGMPLAAMPKSSIFNFIDPDSDRILVLIQMNGGNDGLNMIIPRDQYNGIAAVRNNIMIPENKVLGLTDKIGLNPSMNSIKSLYDDAKIGIVQSVGYPNQNRSHFRSTDIWTSASPAEQFWNTGWLGRHFEVDHKDYPEAYPNEAFPHPFAITMGSIVSETCQGTAANFSMTLEDPFSIFPLYQGASSNVPNTPYGRELSFLRTSISQTNAYAGVITDAADGGGNQVTYPENNRLAQQLKNVALLISGGLQTKVYITSIGGFDTHANQVVGGETTTGDHANLLQMLSEAIAAFQNDLKALGLEQRVVGMTFSEFGRRIRSNESFGTDHGTAAPLIIFGSCINPAIIGENPEIVADVDRDEGVPMQHDFRDVYGSILMDWFGVQETDVKTLLYNDFQKLPIIQDCRTTTAVDGPDLDKILQIKAYPNPFHNWARIEFTLEQEAWVRLSVFDALGSEVKVLTNRRLNPGEHQIPFEASDLAAGTYFYRLQVDNQVKTKRMVKI
ncbi:MAG: DUF1501 domain-containing protein [Saprospiraceae bacterium]|nr:DUF1501 domain-containing protein [Saprospiraceae bacterium]